MYFSMGKKVYGGVGWMERKHTSAVLGTASQKISTLRSPWVVCSYQVGRFC